METFNDALNLWKKTSNEKSDQILNKNEVLLMIKNRIKKQKSIIAQYAFASWVWQFIFYALTVNLIVQVGSNRTILLVSLVGIVLYIPFTVAYAKFCSAFMRNSAKRGAPVDSILRDLKNQYQDLKGFFDFKKKFDLIGIPVIGLFIVMIFVNLNFIPQLFINPIPGIIVYAIFLSVFIATAYSENRKRFIEPLKKLKLIIGEIEMLEHDISA